MKEIDTANRADLARAEKSMEPQIVCYINSNWDAMPMWSRERYGDARVEQSPAIMEMWLNEIGKDRYVHAK